MTMSLHDSGLKQRLRNSVGRGTPGHQQKHLIGFVKHSTLNGSIMIRKVISMNKMRRK
jgi:hypothetical protein